MWTPNLIILCYTLSSIERTVSDRICKNSSMLISPVYYTGCGGNINVYDHRMSAICSPNIPLGYPKNTNCDWHVRSKWKSKFKISLQIRRLNDCCDILRLWDRGHLISIHKRSTNTTSTMIELGIVEDLRINYISGNQNTTYFDGFCVHALSEASGALKNECGGSLQITAPTPIQSPNFPSNYASNLDCTWYVHAKSGQSLRIHVEAMNIEYSRTCSNDVLRLWATKNRTGVAPYQILCGNLSSTSILRTQHLWINFKTDGYVQFKGFRIVIDVDKSRNCDGVKGFYQAVSMGDIRSMKSALSNGFDINCKYGTRSSLHKAVSKRSISIVKFMLDKGADVDIIDIKNRTALFNAVAINSFEITSLLLDRGVHINSADQNGETVLHTTAREGFLQLLQLLLVRGANDRLTNKDGFTAIQIAVENCRIEVCSVLINKTNLLSAKTLLGKTALHIAAGKGNLDLVRLLVEKGSELNATDIVSATPLHYAVKSNSFQIARYLISQGANIDTRNQERETALFGSAITGNTDIAKLLIEHGASVSARMASGETPLHVAIKNNATGVMEFLILVGADISATDNMNSTIFNMCHISTKCYKIMMESVLLYFKQRQNTQISAQRRQGTTMVPRT